MIDGGVRNISPIGDVLDLDPDEIVIINCAPEKPELLAAPPGNILQIGLRTLDLLLNELFISDLREFLHLNDFVLQANAHGHCLLHPTHARPLKHYPCKVINPDIPLGDTLDFSQQAIQLRFQAGWRCARQVFG
jgi:NTE family protein